MRCICRIFRIMGVYTLLETTCALLVGVIPYMYVQYIADLPAIVVYFTKPHLTIVYALYKTQVASYTKISSMEKKNTALIVPNAIEVP